MSSANTNQRGGPRGLILVVDDEAIIREPIAHCLMKAGYAVDVAGSARQAIERAEARRPDLIVLDVHMPGIDGLTCLSTLRAREGTAATPVILLTSEADRAFVMQA